MKTDFSKINPFDLGSIARNRQAINIKIDLSSLRSRDINSAGGKNASVEPKYNLQDKPKKKGSNGEKD